VKITPAYSHPEISETIAKAFAKGKYVKKPLPEGTILKRVEGDVYGSFYTTEAPISRASAEAQLNIVKYKNSLEKVATYRVNNSDAYGYMGGVEGGTGMQIYIPKDKVRQFLIRESEEYLPYTDDWVQYIPGSR
jgi:hypothetical protein